MVINKPSGLVVHESGKKPSETLVDWLLKQYPEIASVVDTYYETEYLQEGEQSDGAKMALLRPGIVHRLDADTSGVMVIAKTQKMFTYLKQQFHDRLVQKNYLAVVHGTFPLTRGTINVPIGDISGGVQIKATGSRAKGQLRDAVTIYRVVKNGIINNQSYSLVECVPKTGRTHQIRVHMKHVGHPIVSDPLYCPRPLLATDKLIIPRLALHAQKLTFNDLQGKTQSFEAVLPQDIDNLIKSLENK